MWVAAPGPVFYIMRKSGLFLERWGTKQFYGGTEKNSMVLNR